MFCVTAAEQLRKYKPRLTPFRMRRVSLKCKFQQPSETRHVADVNVVRTDRKSSGNLHQNNPEQTNQPSDSPGLGSNFL